MSHLVIIIDSIVIMALIGDKLSEISSTSDNSQVSLAPKTKK